MKVKNILYSLYLFSVWSHLKTLTCFKASKISGLFVLRLCYVPCTNLPHLSEILCHSVFLNHSFSTNSLNYNSTLIFFYIQIEYLNFIFVCLQILYFTSLSLKNSHLTHGVNLTYILSYVGFKKL